MILTLHVPGTVIKKVQESLKVYVPPPAESLPRKKPKTSESNEVATQNDDGKSSEKQNKDTRGRIPVPVSEYTVSVKQLSSVVVTGIVSISVPVLKLLARNSVPVIFTEKNRPVAIFNPFATHGSVRTRKEQFKAIDSEKGFQLAKMFVHSALENKSRLLLLLSKNRRRNSVVSARALRKTALNIRENDKLLSGLTCTGNQGKDRYRLMGLEGDGAKQYFQAIGTIIPKAYNFTCRNRRPPKDPVNAMLSLGYALLQGYVTIGVAAVGLEPFAGVLHADRSGKPSMVLDMMEEFRQPVIDRLVLSMVTRRVIKPGHFMNDSSGVRLTRRGMDVFFQNALQRIAPLSPEEMERSGLENFYPVVLGQARNVARFFLGNNPTYKPYLMEW
jgi:CRISPR-associated protein Cas1